MGRPLAPAAGDAGRDTIAAPLDRVRAELARLVVGRARDVPPHPALGDVVLRPHQRTALPPLRRSIAEFGGALLADAPGLGKTYTALALASGTPLAVLGPAAVRSLWADACRRAGRDDVRFVSYERLSASGAPTDMGHGMLVCDEAHHLRNPATRRYAAAARLALGVPVVLLSATPVQNGDGDLRALLALFLGDRAAALPDAALARIVTRRSAADVPLHDAPPVLAPVALAVGDDEPTARALCALPAPVPAADGRAAAALVSLSLLRAWASSAGALRRALRRRLARGCALLDALDAGRHPTRDELRLWSCGDDAAQLAFPGLLPASAAGVALGALTAAVRRHVDAVRHLLDGLTDAADVTRAERLRELRARHRGERIVAFTTAADTVAALWGRLRLDAGVGALTAASARVAGGTLPRRELVARFAPRAAGRPEPRAADRVDLLIATDLLSEGVSLADASVVVHLDAPWNPAVLEQRVGRLARPGSTAARVAVYAIGPPAAAERLLQMERRLRAKLGAASRVAGAEGRVVAWPGLAVDLHRAGLAAHAERTRRTLLGWLDGVGGSPGDAGRHRGRDAQECEHPGCEPGCEHDRLHDEPRWCCGDRREPGLRDAVRARARVVVAACRSVEAGWLAAACDDRGRTRLVARLGDGVACDDPAVVARAVELAGGASCALAATAWGAAAAELREWCARDGAGGVAGLVGACARPRVAVRRLVAGRAASIMRALPPHERARLAPLAARVRGMAGAPGGAGAERVLAELAESALPGEAWLRAVAAFGEAATAARVGTDGAPVPRALVVLVAPP